MQCQPLFLFLGILRGLPKFVSILVPWLCSVSTAFFPPIIDCILGCILISFSHPNFFVSRLISFSPPSITFSFHITSFLGYPVSFHRAHLFAQVKDARWFPEIFLWILLLIIFWGTRFIFAMMFLFPCPIVCFHMAFTEFFSSPFQQDGMCPDSLPVVLLFAHLQESQLRSCVGAGREAWLPLRFPFSAWFSCSASLICWCGIFIAQVPTALRQ